MQQPHGIGAQVAPHAAVGLLVVAAAATHALASATGHEAQVAAWVGGTAFVLAVLVAMKQGQKIECPKSRARLTVLLLGAAVWLGTVTAAGLSWSAVEVLALAVAFLSLHWWRLKRIPNRAAPTVAAPSEYAERWRDYVASGLLPGSRLVSPEIIGAGVRYTLMLVPGRQDEDSVTSVEKKIRGALGLREENYLIIERHSTLPEPHQMLTVVTTSPVKQEILWPGPSAFDSATGRLALGPFVDGLGVGRLRVYSPTRLYGWYMQGGTGGGKTRSTESVAITVGASASHPTVIWSTDGQEGASSPNILAKYADHIAGTPGEVLLLLQDALRVIKHRQDENSLEGWSGFTPTIERPGLLIIMDECHKLMIFPEIQEACDTIAREGGKVGVALGAASQSPLLSAFGGSTKQNHAESIRSNLLMGGGLIFKSKSKDVKQVFEVSVSPSTFPDLPGYTYLVDTMPGERSAPLRSYHFTDAQAAAFLPTYVIRTLDVGAANAAGANYLNRHAIRAKAAAAKRERVDALKAGKPVPRAVEMTTLAAPLLPVAAFPVWVAPVSTPTPTVAAKVSEVHRKVADAVASGDVLRAGFTMPHLVARHLGYSEKWAGIALKELVALGVVHQPAGTPQGRYYPTGKTLSRKAA